MAQQTGSNRQNQGTNAEDQRVKSTTKEPLGRVIEVIGNSTESFDDAIRSAVGRAHQTIRHITGVEVERMTAKVDGDDIVEYRVDLKLAFGVESPENR